MIPYESCITSIRELPNNLGLRVDQLCSYHVNGTLLIASRAIHLHALDRNSVCMDIVITDGTPGDEPYTREEQHALMYGHPYYNKLTTPAEILRVLGDNLVRQTMEATHAWLECTLFKDYTGLTTA